MKKTSGRPRNYLGRGEQRRLFWTWMPLALVVLLVAGWLERSYVRRDDDPRLEQVDTVVPFAGEMVPDAVVIEPERPEAVDEQALDLGAPARSLATVRDDTVFRDGDREAWFSLWQTLRSTDPSVLRKSPATSVSFAELFGQPKAFRGRLVKFTGLLKRLQYVEAPTNDSNIAGYWQAWVRPDLGPPTPVVVYFLDIPPGFPTGERIEERIEVVGYFFKRWAYQATDAIRTAPLVVSRVPYSIEGRERSSPMDWIGSIAMATMFAVVVLSAVAAWLANRGPSRQPEEPTGDLSELAGVETESTEEALQRLSREDLAATSDASSAERGVPPDERSDG
jgi:hypothetical protein